MQIVRIIYEEITSFGDYFYLREWFSQYMVRSAYHSSGFVAIHRDLSPFIGICRRSSGFAAVHRDLSPFIGICRRSSGFVAVHRDL